MLYDRRWDAKIKPDIYALPTLIAWLEKQPAHEEYDYSDCNGACLLDLYRVAHGLRVSSSMEYCDFTEATGWGRDVAALRPRTFGGALERARKLRAVAE